MNDQQPASVGRLLYDLGFEVRHEKLPNGVSGYLQADTWSEKGFEIVVNSLQSKLRQRFSALHELAHYYLHNPEQDLLAVPKHRAAMFEGFANVYSNDELAEELEANEWSDALIFGDKALEAAIGMFGKDVTQLMKRFGFSEQVVRKAMKRRNLL